MWFKHKFKAVNNLENYPFSLLPLDSHMHRRCSEVFGSKNYAKGVWRHYAHGRDDRYEDFCLLILLNYNTVIYVPFYGPGLWPHNQVNPFIPWSGWDLPRLSHTTRLESLCCKRHMNNNSRSHLCSIACCYHF